MVKRKSLFSGIGKGIVMAREGMFDSISSLTMLKESTVRGAKLSKKKDCCVDYIDGNGQKMRFDGVLSPSEILISVDDLGMVFFTRSLTKYYDLDLEKPCFICYNNWHETVSLRDNPISVVAIEQPTEAGKKIMDAAIEKGMPIIKYIQKEFNHEELEEAIRNVGITCTVSNYQHARSADFTRKCDIILSSKWIDQFDDVPSRMILMAGIFGMLIGMLVMAMTLFAFMR